MDLRLDRVWPPRGRTSVSGLPPQIPLSRREPPVRAQAGVEGQSGRPGATGNVSLLGVPPK